ncbi:hypothetical protein SprV_0200643400 [Sparganum proliferum]
MEPETGIEADTTLAEYPEGPPSSQILDILTVRHLPNGGSVHATKAMRLTPSTSTPKGPSTAFLIKVSGIKLRNAGFRERLLARIERFWTRRSQRLHVGSQKSSERRRLAQQRFRGTQDARMTRKVKEIQGYANRRETKDFVSVKSIYDPPPKGTIPLLSCDGSIFQAERSTTQKHPQKFHHSHRQHRLLTQMKTSIDLDLPPYQKAAAPNNNSPAGKHQIQMPFQLNSASTVTTN